jgi:hypothetical protein
LQNLWLYCCTDFIMRTYCDEYGHLLRND